MIVSTIQDSSPTAPSLSQPVLSCTKRRWSVSQELITRANPPKFMLCSPTFLSGFHRWHLRILDFATRCRWSQIGVLPAATDGRPSLCTAACCSNPPKSSSLLYNHISQILIGAKVVSIGVERLFVCPIVLLSRLWDGHHGKLPALLLQLQQFPS